MDVEQILAALGISREKHDDPKYLKDAIARLWKAIVEDDRLLQYIRDTYK